MHVIILGTETGLGKQFKRHLEGCLPEGSRVDGFGLPDFSVSDRHQVKEVVGQADWLINCQQVTQPEEVEDNHDFAYMMNMDGARYVAEACARRSIRLVHFSSAHVYDGMKPKPYTERDLPNPVNRFGASMVAGEKAVRGAGGHYLIIRPGALVGEGKGLGPIESALPVLQAEDPLVEVIEDERLSPTHVGELVDATATLMRGDQHGLLNVAGKGGCSWLELYRYMAELMGIEKEFRGVKSSDIRTGVRIPLNMELETHWYRRWTGKALSDWQSVVRRVIEANGMLA